MLIQFQSSFNQIVQWTCTITSNNCMLQGIERVNDIGLISIDLQNAFDLLGDEKLLENIAEVLKLYRSSKRF